LDLIAPTGWKLADDTVDLPGFDLERFRLDLDSQYTLDAFRPARDEDFSTT
jgi:hypothetical protein